MPFFIPHLTLAGTVVGDVFTFDLLNGMHTLFYMTKRYNHFTFSRYEQGPVYGMQDGPCEVGAQDVKGTWQKALLLTGCAICVGSKRLGDCPQQAGAGS